MNQPQQVGQDNDGSQINPNMVPQESSNNPNKKNLKIFLIILVILIPVAIAQYYLSTIIGWMRYCGIEGSCDYPKGFTYLLYVANVLIDLIAILILRYKTNIFKS